MQHVPQNPTPAALVALEGAQDQHQLACAVYALRDMLGVEHACYHWVNAPGGQIALGTYPPRWVERYIEAGYVRLDPVVLGCAQSFSGIDWKDLEWSARELRAFLAESARYGLGHQGYSVPVHGPRGEFAILSVNHSCPDDKWAGMIAACRADLAQIGRALHERMRRILPASRGYRALSPREADVICLLAQGQSRAQAARDLEISEHTLRDYIESARVKLEATNTTHAVARALSRGLVVA